MTFSISSLWLLLFILSSFPWYNFSANLSDSWLIQLSKGLDAGLMLYYYLSVSYLIPFASDEITRGDFKRGGMRYLHLVTVSNCNLDWLLPLFQKYSACSASASSPAFFCLPRTTNDLSLSWIPSSLTKKWSNIFQEWFCDCCTSQQLSKYCSRHWRHHVAEFKGKNKWALVLPHRRHHPQSDVNRIYTLLHPHRHTQRSHTCWMLSTSNTYFRLHHLRTQ